jgi:hypothetical protein
LNVQPATAYEAVVNIGTTGLAGTLRLRTIDNDGGVTQAAASTGITEVAYGVYSAERTSPATVGNYTLVWDGGTNNDVRSIEELLVTRSGPAPLTSGPNYLTADELKATLALTGQVFADDDLDLAISAASAAVNEACSRRFYPVTETRYFTGSASRGGDESAAIRLARTDPDFEFYLAPFIETGPLVS